MKAACGIAVAALLALPVSADTRYAPSSEAIAAAQAVADSMSDARLRDIAYAGLQEADAATGARDCRIADAGLEQSWLIMSGHVAASLTSDDQLQPVLERAARFQALPSDLLADGGQVKAVEDLIDAVDELVGRFGPLAFQAGYVRVDDSGAILIHDCP